MFLRADQEKAVEEIRAAFESGARSPCLVMPTGSGKTATALTYLDRYEKEGNVIWLVPRAALVDQAWRAARTWASEDLRRRLRPTTVQGLLASPALPRPGSIGVVDEAHFFYGTASWGAVAHTYGRRLAATATPARADGAALGQLCDRLVVGISRAALTKRRILPPVVVYGPPGKRSTEAWPPAEAYLAKTPRERAIVFCGSIGHAQAVAEQFRAAGVSVGVATSEDDRDLELHRAGHIDVLCNVFMVSVGYDDPTVTVVILARPMGNASTYLQAIGRARGRGAPRVAVIDLYGNFHEWGLPEQDRKYSLKGEPIRAKKSSFEICACCGAAYQANPFRVQCSLCQGPLPKFETPIAKKRAEVEERRKAETIDAKRSYFYQMLGVAKKTGRLWLVRSAYRKRYGCNPPFDWMVREGLT